MRTEGAVTPAWPLRARSRPGLPGSLPSPQEPRSAPSWARSHPSPSPCTESPGPDWGTHLGKSPDFGGAGINTVTSGPRVSVQVPSWPVQCKTDM